MHFLWSIKHVQETLGFMIIEWACKFSFYISLKNGHSNRFFFCTWFKSIWTIIIVWIVYNNNIILYTFNHLFTHEFKFSNACSKQRVMSGNYYYVSMVDIKLFWLKKRHINQPLVHITLHGIFRSYYIHQ